MIRVYRTALLWVIFGLALSPVCIYSQTKRSFLISPNISGVWTADNGDGTYKNPIIHADYSDPDAIRVGEDFYMTASSFNAAPGLPILRSKDLVNWRIVDHVFREQAPREIFARPQHGGGVWARRYVFTTANFIFTMATRTLVST